MSRKAKKKLPFRNFRDFLPLDDSDLSDVDIQPSKSVSKDGSSVEGTLSVQMPDVKVVARKSGFFKAFGKKVAEPMREKENVVSDCNGNQNVDEITTPLNSTLATNNKDLPVASTPFPGSVNRERFFLSPILKNVTNHVLDDNNVSNVAAVATDNLEKAADNVLEEACAPTASAVVSNRSKVNETTTRLLHEIQAIEEQQKSHKFQMPEVEPKNDDAPNSKVEALLKRRRGLRNIAQKSRIKYLKRRIPKDSPHMKMLKDLKNHINNIDAKITQHEMRQTRLSSRDFDSDTGVRPKTKRIEDLLVDEPMKPVPEASIQATDSTPANKDNSLAKVQVLEKSACSNKVQVEEEPSPRTPLMGEKNGDEDPVNVSEEVRIQASVRKSTRLSSSRIRSTPRKSKSLCQQVLHKDMENSRRRGEKISGSTLNKIFTPPSNFLDIRQSSLKSPPSSKQVNATPEAGEPYDPNEWNELMDNNEPVGSPESEKRPVKRKSSLELSQKNVNDEGANQPKNIRVETPKVASKSAHTSVLESIVPGAESQSKEKSRNEVTEKKVASIAEKSTPPVKKTTKKKSLSKSLNQESVHVNDSKKLQKSFEEPPKKRAVTRKSLRLSEKGTQVTPFIDRFPQALLNKHLILHKIRTPQSAKSTPKKTPTTNALPASDTNTLSEISEAIDPPVLTSPGEVESWNKRVRNSTFDAPQPAKKPSNEASLQTEEELVFALKQTLQEESREAAVNTSRKTKTSVGRKSLPAKNNSTLNNDALPGSSQASVVHAEEAGAVVKRGRGRPKTKSKTGEEETGRISNRSKASSTTTRRTTRSVASTASSHASKKSTTSLSKLPVPTILTFLDYYVERSNRKKYISKGYRSRRERSLRAELKAQRNQLRESQASTCNSGRSKKTQASDTEPQSSDSNPDVARTSRRYQSSKSQDTIVADNNSSEDERPSAAQPTALPTIHDVSTDIRTSADANASVEICSVPESEQPEPAVLERPSLPSQLSLKLDDFLENFASDNFKLTTGFISENWGVGLISVQPLKSLGMSYASNSVCCYCISGSGRCTIDGKESKLGSKITLLIPEGCNYEIRNTGRKTKLDMFFVRNVDAGFEVNA